ncbi:MAG: HAD-IIB family hydrolase [Halieaceae bacterium]|nr:HAD-IIB family hydrolase [Halieaceae bacterium]
MANAIYLVVTDLDGSLLDHHDYTWEAARPALQLLEELRIPVVFASSKTRPEILELRSELGNEHPFIVENGAAAYIPDGYFVDTPRGCERHGAFWRRAFAPPRQRWGALLDEQRARHPGAFQDFATADADEIVAMTGLPPEKAALANEREFSEPVQWRGSEAQLRSFLAAVRDAGARALRGGRFLSIAGDCDKGEAWRWLRDQYVLAAGGASLYDLSLGDGNNDVPMLELTHRAALIAAPGRAAPDLCRVEGVIRSEALGPAGWAEAVRQWLGELYAGAAAS